MTYRSIKTRCLDSLWNTDTAHLPWYGRFPINTARIIFVIARDAREGQMTLHATGLVYTTLIALVPLIALSFSLLKGFGMHDVLVPTLQQFLAPLGDKGDQLARQITAFVGNVNAGVLGSVGVVLLIWSVISMLQKVESAFNDIWNIQHGRFLLRRFSDYLSVVIIGPVLTVGAFGLTATISSQSAVTHLTHIEPFGTLALVVARIAPYLFVIAAFTFVYIFAPNTRVKFIPALIGGIIAGVLWQSAGLGFTLFTASTTRVTAIYSGFAILIFFLIWLFLSWLILLIGAKIVFYVQFPDFISRFRIDHRLDVQQREKLALLVMALVSHRFLRQQQPPTTNDLARITRTPGNAIETTCNQLYHAGLLLNVDTSDGGYVPSRDMTTITLDEIVAVVRHAGSEEHITKRYLPPCAPVERAAQRIDAAICTAIGSQTLRDLALEVDTDADFTAHETQTERHSV